MRRWWWRILLIVLLGGLVAAIVVPLIDDEAMKVPMTHVLAAIQQGNAPALRRCFTPDATVSARTLTLSASSAIDMIEPWLAGRRLQGMRVRFGGYDNLVRQAHGLVTARVTVWAYLEGGDDIPYRRVPIRKTGQVTLKNVGLFRWKIQHLSSTEPEIGEVLPHR